MSPPEVPFDSSDDKPAKSPANRASGKKADSGDSVKKSGGSEPVEKADPSESVAKSPRSKKSKTTEQSPPIQRSPSTEIRAYHDSPFPLISRKSSSVESFSPYDPAEADRSVKVGNLIGDARFWSMLKTMLSFTYASISDKMHPPKTAEESEARQKTRAVRLKTTCISLGETYIKLGQFLSVRRDALPVEIADELSLLQDQVPPFDFETVKTTIKRDLGASPDELFAHFEETPIASASVGQVHRARLKDGTEVAVKVQRPQLRQRFYQDLGYMRFLIRLGSALFKKHADWDGWYELADEFGRNLFAEVNYIQEGRNADRLRRVLRDYADIRVPRVFWKYTGRRVLTLEFLPGTKIDRVKELLARNVNLPRLGKLLVTCYLEQVLMHGFFHADPHAGNLAVDEDGRLVIYDFGMVGEISDEQRQAITGCISAVIQKNTEDLLTNLRKLGILKESANSAPIERAVKPFIDYYAGREVKDLDFTDLENDIDQIALDRSLCLPPSLAYLLRAGSTIEGIARTLQPNFSFVEAAKPALKKWIMNRPQQAVPLLRLFYGGNVTLLEESLSRLSGTHDLPQSSQNALKKGARITNSGTQKELETSIKEAQAADLQTQKQVANLNHRLQLLETSLSANKRKRLGLSLLSAALCLFDLAYIGSTQITEIRPLAPYFLIGNGVMVAIIMWHLVTPVSLITRLDKPDSQGGSGD
ncbi:MAG TPA: AarF/ABC1/UbiB kinase family protein [Candidatus Melainabacteria bacterium]|nr:AarF/ABC1/UbiB kinase family protein [Candidatus Melainabacteria bacterium]